MLTDDSPETRGQREWVAYHSDVLERRDVGGQPVVGDQRPLEPLGSEVLQEGAIDVLVADARTPRIVGRADLGVGHQRPEPDREHRERKAGA